MCIDVHQHQSVAGIQKTKFITVNSIPYFKTQSKKTTFLLLVLIFLFILSLSHSNFRNELRILDYYRMPILLVILWMHLPYHDEIKIDIKKKNDSCLVIRATLLFLSISPILCYCTFIFYFYCTFQTKIVWNSF